VVLYSYFITSKEWEDAKNIFFVSLEKQKQA
jgi:hypothetical protein